MKTEEKIVKMMVEEKKPFSIRKIANKAGISYRITHTATQRLIEKEIIKKKIVGKSSSCSLNENYYGIEIYQAEYERASKLLKNKNLKQLYKELSFKLPSAFFVLLVFGSYAKNKQSKASDIDIMFITPEKKKFEKSIESILRLLPLKVHCLVLSEQEFRRMLQSRETNVVKEIINCYVILYGIENYYKLKTI